MNSSAWGKFKAIIDRFHSVVNQDNLIWLRHTPQVTLFNEEESSLAPTSITLKVLIGYNFFRTWPITRHSESGELDNQNMVVLINREYLRSLGYLTPQGYFNFRPDKDYFLHDGIKYKSEGDTYLSQAGETTKLFIQLILKREEVDTGVQPFYQNG